MTNATRFALAEIGVRPYNGPSAETLTALESVAECNRRQHLITSRDLARAFRVADMRANIHASKTTRAMRIVTKL
jgi:hypothetical protein